MENFDTKPLLENEIRRICKEGGASIMDLTVLLLTQFNILVDNWTVEEFERNEQIFSSRSEKHKKSFLLMIMICCEIEKNITKQYELYKKRTESNGQT